MALVETRRGKTGGQEVGCSAAEEERKDEYANKYAKRQNTQFRRANHFHREPLSPFSRFHAGQITITIREDTFKQKRAKIKKGPYLWFVPLCSVDTI
jgi:hypothetical protein